MKNLLNIFFTMPSKIIMVIILFSLSIVISNCQVEYFTLYKEDNESFINAITQLNSFDYETSHYFKSRVKQTVDDVTALCMEYNDILDNELSDEKLLNHYNSIGDSNFLEMFNRIGEIKDLKFALVNHSRKIIYSNIKSINNKPSSTDVRSSFGLSGKNLLIVRSCHNPYFETDAFIGFAEFIRECAKKYDDNFDLYISFGTEKTFRENEAKYEKLHFEMCRKIEKLTNTVIIHVAVLAVCIIILLTVTGKQELGGKTYPTIINRLPNDLIVLLYSIVLVCQTSLFRTTAAMLLAHGNELEVFWFNRSEDFYTVRLKVCTIVFIFTATNLMCILKRQYKLGCLFKNTHIYTIISKFKSE